MTARTRTSQHPIARRARHPVARGVAVALAVLALGACSDDDDDDADGGASGMNGSPAGDFAVVMNDGSSPGSVQLFSPDLASAVGGPIQSGANQGAAYGPDGTLYQNSDAEGMAGLFVVDPESGATTQIGSSPGKGLSYVGGGQDLLASCDVTDEGADLKLFSPTATDASATPVATVDLPAPCWDTFWDEDNGRLYAALTDGSLAIFDDFAAVDPTGTGIDLTAGATVDRTVTPAGGMSANLHGVYAEDGTVLVSDVGATTMGPNSDGMLFVFDDADGTMDGEVEPVRTIGGPATQLGNPVDVVLLDGAAIVAEKTNDALLVFEDVADADGMNDTDDMDDMDDMDGAGGVEDVMPDYQQSFTKPESIELAVGGVSSGGDDGSTDGVTDGTTDGTDGGTDGTDGTTDGVTDGGTDGTTDGTDGGATDGGTDGTTDGVTDGVTDGGTDGTTDGTDGGTTDGATDGTTDGATDGTTDGTDGATGGG